MTDFRASIDPTEFQTVMRYLRNPQSPIDHILYVKSQPMLAEVAGKLDAALSAPRGQEAAVRAILDPLLASGSRSGSAAGGPASASGRMRSLPSVPTNQLSSHPTNVHNGFPQLQTKAAQYAGLLVSDVREAHKRACRDNPGLEILLRDLLGEVVRIENRLAELQSTMDN